MNVLNYERDAVAVHNGELTYSDITNNILHEIDKKRALNAFLHVHADALHMAEQADAKTHETSLLHG
ncbi:MAG: hypothetical protein ACKOAK_01270, partial [Ignavibacteria bacterium]